MASKYRWAPAGVLLALLGCSDQAGPVAPGIALELHVASWFQDEHVDIALDGSRVYAGVVTTQLSGVAASLYTSSPRGAHRVDVRVAELSCTSEFVLNEPTYVIIFRSAQDHELNVTVTHERPLWQ